MASFSFSLKMVYLNFNVPYIQYLWYISIEFTYIVGLLSFTELGTEPLNLEIQALQFWEITLLFFDNAFPHLNSFYNPLS